MLPPNPAELDASNAAALAAEAGRVFQYLARVARAAAELAESAAEESDYLAACAPEGDDRESAEEYARQAAVSAWQAAVSADRAERARRHAERFGVLGHAAEDTEPAALAEVAATLAEAVALALAAITEETPL